MLTVQSLVDAIEPYMKQAIHNELPFGTRWVAEKICRWKIRKVIEIGIAMHGHQVASVMKPLESIGEKLFKPTVATAFKDVRGLCETPVAALGEECQLARINADPPPEQLTFLA